LFQQRSQPFTKNFANKRSGSTFTNIVPKQVHKMRYKHAHKRFTNTFANKFPAHWLHWRVLCSGAVQEHRLRTSEECTGNIQTRSRTRVHKQASRTPFTDNSHKHLPNSMFTYVHRTVSTWRISFVGKFWTESIMTAFALLGSFLLWTGK